MDVLFLGSAVYAAGVDPAVKDFISANKEKIGAIVNLSTAALLPSTYKQVKKFAETFAKIVDYKSSFTKNHSLGVAEIADKMADFYNFDPTQRIRFYFAAALHDVGKLIIPNDILEKPGKLTSDEFVQMKTHAYATFEVLNKIPGLEDIAILACSVI